MEVNDKLLNQVTSFGMLNYGIDRMCNILDLDSDSDIQEFERFFSDKRHPVYRAYKKGVDKADYHIDLKLFEQAKKGDKKALEMLERRKYERG